MTRRSLRRILVLTLMLTVVLTASAMAQTKIVQWSFPLLEGEEERLWKPLVAQFNELHPDIEVQVEVLPWAGRDERLLTAVASGNPPDVVYLNEFFLQTFAARGALEAVNDFIDRNLLLERFPEPLLDTGRQGDDYFLVPMLTGNVGIIYNIDIVEAAGWDVNQLPETWDEYLQFASDVKQYAIETDQDIWPVGYTANMEETLNMTLFPFLWQAGGDILTEDLSQAAFNSPAGQAAFELVQTFAQEEYVSQAMMTSGGLPDYYLDGRIASFTGVNAAMIEELRERDPNLNNYTAVGPLLKNEERITYTTLGAWAIFKNANDPEAAARWIEFLTSPDVNVEFNKMTGFTSPILDAPALFADDPLLGVLEEQSVYGRGGMVIEQERRVMDVLKRAQQAVMLGQSSIEDALRSAEQEINFILR